MTNIKISNRLKTIGDLITNDSNVCDIGCDHALLSIYLCLNKKNISVIASDINSKPLESAKKNIEKYNLNNKIKLVLSDGLNNIHYYYDTIIISGLGGNTIIDILKKDKLSNVNKIVVSPQNNTYNVRKYINKLGYYISNEILIKENNHIYIILEFKRGIQRYNNKQLLLGPILLKKKDELFYENIKNKYFKYLGVLNQLPKNKLYKRFVIKSYLNKLKRVK